MTSRWCDTAHRSAVLMVLALVAGAASWAAPRRYLQVNSARGRVERRARGASKWLRARVGDKLTKGAALRTGKNSSSVLRLDGADSTIVYVGANSEMEVRLLVTTAQGGRQSQFYVRRGLVRGAVRKLGNSTSRFRIQTPACMGGVRGTDLALTVGQTGFSAVGVLSGNVAVSAQGQEVSVPGGMMSRTKPGKPPTPPEPLPTSLSIHLDSPTADVVTNQPSFEIKGRTAPGAQVTLNGTDVMVADDGAFAVTVKLEDGNNEFTFRGVDVAGNTDAVTRRIRLDRQAPPLKLD